MQGLLKAWNVPWHMWNSKFYVLCSVGWAHLCGHSASNLLDFTMMNSFCKMVGFPIVKCEAQCVALFRLLDQECLEVANDGCNRWPVEAGQKGLRELRGLISTVNNDGTYSQNRGSSTGLGAIGGHKCP